VVLTTFISAYSADSDMARALLNEGKFFENFVDTPLYICVCNATLIATTKAGKGEIKDLTGINLLYGPPQRPDIRYQVEFRIKIY